MSLKKSLFKVWLVIIQMALLLGCAQQTENKVTEVPEAIEPLITDNRLVIDKVASNEEWEPVYKDFDGVQMALVPSGCFLMGTEDAAFEFELPVHEQCLDESFWIDVTEVTVAAFASPEAVLISDYPRTDVTWFEAYDHCLKRNARLPTELEWEYAARGPNNLLYPWGNDQSNYVVVYDVGAPEPVGLFLGGASWVGALDMSGNVSEWVSSQYMPYPYNADDGREELPDRTDDTHVNLMVIRGGDWAIDNPYYLRANFRGSAPAKTSNEFVGFRCARDYDGP
jgi:formylglycine-generating enzyme required for sulfatase activity